MGKEDNSMIEYFMISAVLSAVLILITLSRVIFGKTYADKMVALDVINILVVISIIILSIVFSQPIFVDIAIVYALLSFVATLYIAKHVAGGTK